MNELTAVATSTTLMLYLSDYLGDIADVETASITIPLVKLRVPANVSTLTVVAVVTAVVATVIITVVAAIVAAVVPVLIECSVREIIQSHSDCYLGNATTIVI